MGMDGVDGIERMFDSAGQGGQAYPNHQDERDTPDYQQGYEEITQAPPVIRRQPQDETEVYEPVQPLPTLLSRQRMKATVYARYLVEHGQDVRPADLLREGVRISVDRRDVPILENKIDAQMQAQQAAYDIAILQREAATRREEVDSYKKEVITRAANRATPPDSGIDNEALDRAYEDGLIDGQNEAQLAKRRTRKRRIGASIVAFAGLSIVYGMAGGVLNAVNSHDGKDGSLDSVFAGAIYAYTDPARVFMGQGPKTIHNPDLTGTPTPGTSTTSPTAIPSLEQTTTTQDEVTPKPKPKKTVYVTVTTTESPSPTATQTETKTVSPTTPPTTPSMTSTGKPTTEVPKATSTPTTGTTKPVIKPTISPTTKPATKPTTPSTKTP